tara:strand:+ start:107 stop:346 length:240 start_codon:yes stop_codon:yes gene_type:complete
MSASLHYSALTRLLTLNNQVHDLENQLRGVVLSGRGKWLDSPVATQGPDQVAQMQEQIDRGVRASLTACWLGMPGELDE